MLRSIICLAIVTTHLGCASRQVPSLTPIARSTEATPPEPTTVAPGGRYLLRTCPDDPRAKQHPITVEKYLSVGNALGFEVTAKGDLQAVAGTERISLESGYTYEWCLEVFKPISIRTGNNSNESTFWDKTVEGAIKVGDATLSVVGLAALACLRIVLGKNGSTSNGLQQY